MSELSVGSLSGLAANSYVIDVASGSQLTQPGMILQVVSVTKTDTFGTTSSTLVDVTGLSATITPSSTGSKILILVQTYGANTAEGLDDFALLRDSTLINNADGYSYYHRSSFGVDATERKLNYAVPVTFLDSPATTSATTYKIQVKTSAGTLLINRTATGSSYATVSSITLLEVAG